MEDYELEKSIYGWTMKIGNIGYYDVPEDFALIIKQLEEKYNIEKSKNDKAIEYITSEEYFDLNNRKTGSFVEDSNNYLIAHDNLLDILRGEE